ncbi:MAG: hypothetical protein GF353_24165, partial [Candidatus Lokiarchaeota archaeon]|nr:hypothetical protein [Candidatus Lokiarchaeota archaeon]
MNTLDYLNVNEKQIGPDLQIAPIVFRARQAVKFLNEKQRVLVVGCANGQDCEVFINNGHEVFGTDIVYRRLH